MATTLLRYKLQWLTIAGLTSFSPRASFIQVSLCGPWFLIFNSQGSGRIEQALSMLVLIGWFFFLGEEEVVRFFHPFLTGC